MVVVVMGVSGAGKTTVGKLLAVALGFDFLDADELHSRQNVEKMARGVPLTDADRAGWLELVRNRVEAYLKEGREAVVACSALREDYRDYLRVDSQAVQFVYLKGEYPMLKKRLDQRRHHFMPPELLVSQLDTLEEPNDALTVGIDQPPEQLVKEIRRGLGLNGG
jgi:gluconokinase